MSLDLYNIASNSDRTQIFYGNIGLVTTSTVYHWVKPRGVTMIHITVIGAGGGGGGGASTTNATAGSGGAGGGSGAITRLTIPAILLTDELEIICASGGIGGAAGTVGNNAGATVVECARSPIVGVAANRIIQSNGGNGGNAGTAAGNPTGGAAGGITTIDSSVYQSLGSWNSIAGQVGGAGVSAGSGVTINYGGTTPLAPTSAGTAGGGKTAAGGNFVGGSITSTGNTPTILGGVVGGGRGSSGVFNLTPFYSYGGTGGGSNVGSIGGIGGNGGPGSGGGGGGAGLTGGSGGNGGPSMVIITCW